VSVRTHAHTPNPDLFTVIPGEPNLEELMKLMGKAMLDTRGLGWPWIIHMTIDTAIYTFLALSAMGSL